MSFRPRLVSRPAGLESTITFQNLVQGDHAVPGSFVGLIFSGDIIKFLFCTYESLFYVQLLESCA